MAKRKITEMGKHGIYWPAWLEKSQEVWECVNAVSEGDGAVFKDFMKVMEPWIARYKVMFDKF